MTQFDGRGGPVKRWNMLLVHGTHFSTFLRAQIPFDALKLFHYPPFRRHHVHSPVTAQEGVSRPYNRSYPKLILLLGVSHACACVYQTQSFVKHMRRTHPIFTLDMRDFVWVQVGAGARQWKRVEKLCVTNSEEKWSGNSCFRSQDIDLPLRTYFGVYFSIGSREEANGPDTDALDAKCVQSWSYIYPADGRELHGEDYNSGDPNWDSFGQCRIHPQVWIDLDSATQKVVFLRQEFTVWVHNQPIWQ